MAERHASSYLSNPSDPSMLTNKEIKEGWGKEKPFTNFMGLFLRLLVLTNFILGDTDNNTYPFCFPLF